MQIFRHSVVPVTSLWLIETNLCHPSGRLKTAVYLALRFVLSLEQHTK